MEGPGRDLDRMPGEGDPRLLRISDAERHVVAEVLREAAGEGRIDLTELDERLEAAYRARTYADLEPLTADLPQSLRAEVPRPPTVAVARRVVAGTPATRPSYSTSIAVMSETRRVGVWQSETSHAAMAFMGSVVLDLRQAALPPESVITAVAFMGGIDVIVDAHTHVVVDGVGFMGEFSERRSKVPTDFGPDSPVVRVRGLAMMGSVIIRRKGAQ